jgi:SAM-dependent methyltransferase
MPGELTTPVEVASLRAEMALPDASRLLAISASQWRTIGARLARVGLTKEFAREVMAVAPGLPDSVNRPMRLWHLRRSRTPAALAMRMLVFGDAVPAREAKRSLGADFVGALLEAGLLDQTEHGLVSGFELSLVGDLYLLGDYLGHGGDAVMGPSPLTFVLAQAAYPHHRVEHLLDLGCGAGTIALLLSEAAASCVATDVNARAVAVARTNAAINGIANIEARDGSLFDPVADQRFDLIVSQPPFVPRPHGIEPASYLHGGARGDELALELLARVPRHLAPGGRAVLMVDWPSLGETAVEDRVEAAVASADTNLLLVHLRSAELDEYCALYATLARFADGAAFEHRAMLMRDHLEDLAIRDFRLTLTVLEPAGETGGWTSTLDLAKVPHNRTMTSREIDEMIAARNLLARGSEALLAAGLALAEEAGPEPSDLEGAAGGASDGDQSRLLELVDRSSTVGQAIDTFADESGIAHDQAADLVAEALLRGTLQTRAEPQPGTRRDAT